MGRRLRRSRRRINRPFEIERERKRDWKESDEEIEGNRSLMIGRKLFVCR
jgi:hypothetical protein